MSEELIKRLRGHVEIMERDKGKFIRFIDAETCIEAADRIADLTAENERLKAALTDHNDALRTAAMVAGRDGKDTNWLTFRGQLHWVLAGHHEITNEARATLKGGDA